jgi:hypothetical protein
MNPLSPAPGAKHAPVARVGPAGLTRLPSPRWAPAPLPPSLRRLAAAPTRPEQTVIKLMKARSAAECERLEQLPNIGPSMAADLRRLGIHHPQGLIGQDALVLYRRLEATTGQRQDPCVLDTFIAACEFMAGGVPRPWWAYTARRKQQYGVL